MLQTFPMHAYIPVKDIARARSFYEGKLGFKPKEEAEGGVPTLALDNARLRFVPDADGRGEGLGGIDLVATNRARALAAARERGCLAGDDVVSICGMRLRLV